MKQTFFFIFAFALYNFNITNDLSAGINSAKADMADCLPGCANMEVITVTAAGPSFWTSTAYVSTPSPNDLTSFSMFDVAESMSNEVASVQEDIAANKLDVEMAQDFITAALAIKNEIHKILNNASISRFLPESEKAALRAMVDRINKALDKATKYIQFANLGEQALAHQLGGETLLAINELVAYGVGELVERLVRFPIVAQIAGAV
ncbi:hypothetical protein [Pseudoalteromonas sp.]|uniref:hypothetical protein n=1 Tax=Pseudoalteromonas sp. TaxID=53249 RepID=UPI0026084D7C|nr:hypothetical protein [Pseudoalteromonas sp.]MCP4056633.1 hypothetical protein [Pseudoalteromonas sp.]MCP4585576.1 hypothetical protein [Pseudoalteromonas sp.]